MSHNNTCPPCESEAQRKENERRYKSMCGEGPSGGMVPQVGICLKSNQLCPRNEGADCPREVQIPKNCPYASNQCEKLKIPGYSEQLYSDSDAYGRGRRTRSSPTKRCNRNQAYPGDFSFESSKPNRRTLHLRNLNDTSGDVFADETRYQRQPRDMESPFDLRDLPGNQRQYQAVPEFPGRPACLDDFSESDTQYMEIPMARGEMSGRSYPSEENNTIPELRCNVDPSSYPSQETRSDPVYPREMYSGGMRSQNDYPQTRRDSQVPCCSSKAYPNGPPVRTLRSPQQPYNQPSRGPSPDYQMQGNRFTPAPKGQYSPRQVSFKNPSASRQVFNPSESSNMNGSYMPSRSCCPNKSGAFPMAQSQRPPQIQNYEDSFETSMAFLPPLNSTQQNWEQPQGSQWSGPSPACPPKSRSGGDREEPFREFNPEGKSIFSMLGMSRPDIQWNPGPRKEDYGINSCNESTIQEPPQSIFSMVGMAKPDIQWNPGPRKEDYGLNSCNESTTQEPPQSMFSMLGMSRPDIQWNPGPRKEDYGINSCNESTTQEPPQSIFSMLGMSKPNIQWNPGPRKEDYGITSSNDCTPLNQQSTNFSMFGRPPRKRDFGIPGSDEAECEGAQNQREASRQSRSCSPCAQQYNQQQNVSGFPPPSFHGNSAAQYSMQQETQDSQQQIGVPFTQDVLRRLQERDQMRNQPCPISSDEDETEMSGRFSPGPPQFSSTHRNQAPQGDPRWMTPPAQRRAYPPPVIVTPQCPQTPQNTGRMYSTQCPPRAPCPQQGPQGMMPEQFQPRPGYPPGVRPSCMQCPKLPPSPQDEAMGFPPNGQMPPPKAGDAGVDEDADQCSFSFMPKLFSTIIEKFVGSGSPQEGDAEECREAFQIQPDMRDKATVDPREMAAVTAQSEEREQRKANSRQQQFNSLVLDTYNPGLIQDSVNCNENFNDVAFKLVFGGRDRVPQTKPEVEPISLLEAFALRIDYERKKCDQDVDEKPPDHICIEEFQPMKHGPRIINTSKLSRKIEAYFDKQPETDLSHAICAFLKAEKIFDQNDPFLGARPTFLAQVYKSVNPLPNWRLPLELAIYTGVSNPN